MNDINIQQLVKEMNHAIFLDITFYSIYITFLIFMTIKFLGIFFNKKEKEIILLENSKELEEYNKINS